MKLLGKKLYMTAVYDDKRNQIPVTVLEINPCYVTQIKTAEKEGYQAVQIGCRATKEHRLTAPKLGHLKKAGVAPLSKLLEFRNEETKKYTVGDALTVEQFSIGDIVRVTSRSKGRGFSGVVRRYNFRGGPKTHGQSDRHRAPGSIGASSDPSRVMKGMHMPGHMGNKRTTIRNLEVINIDKEKNLLLVKGSVPGSRNSLVEVSRG